MKDNVCKRNDKDLRLAIEELRKGARLLAKKLREKEREIIKLNAKIAELEKKND